MATSVRIINVFCIQCTEVSDAALTYAQLYKAKSYTSLIYCTPPSGIPQGSMGPLWAQLSSLVFSFSFLIHDSAASGMQ